MQQITNENIKEILSFINPAVLSYQEWINIGMALKDEGIDCSVWDEWSQNDSRYHAGECERKWKTFNGSSSPVTIATVMQMAFENGYRSGTDSYELDWDSEIGGTKDDFVIVDKNWIESKEIKEPAVWNPAAPTSPTSRPTTMRWRAGPMSSSSSSAPPGVPPSTRRTAKH